MLNLVFLKTSVFVKSSIFALPKGCWWGSYQRLWIFAHTRTDPLRDSLFGFARPTSRILNSTLVETPQRHVILEKIDNIVPNFRSFFNTQVIKIYNALQLRNSVQKYLCAANSIRDFEKNVKIVENSTFYPLITDGTPQKPPLEHLYKLSGCIKYLRTWS